MIALLLAGLALGGEHVEAAATLGMRAGVAGQLTVEPRPHLEAGGRLHLATDVYAGAPAWVRSGLDPKHNLHVSPLALAGVNTGDTAVSLAAFLGAGVELSTYREVRRLPSLPGPVDYGATGLRPAGAVLLDLRIRARNGTGATVQLNLPMPLAPTGFLYIDRIHLGLGVHFGSPRGAERTEP